MQVNSGLGEVSCKKKSKAWFLEEFLSDMPGSDITPVVGSLLRELPCSKWHNISEIWRFPEISSSKDLKIPPSFQKGKYIDSTVRSIFQTATLVYSKSPPDFHVFTMEMGAHFPTDPTLRTDPRLGPWNVEQTAWKLFWHFPSWKPGRWKHPWRKCSIWWLRAEPFVPWRPGR